MHLLQAVIKLSEEIKLNLDNPSKTVDSLPVKIKIII